MNAIPKPLAAPQPAEITILMYHGVRRAGFPANIDSDPVYELMQGPFARQLDHVANSGAAVTTLAALGRHAGETAREGRAVVLSFDDGIACHADVVVPMLLDHRRAFAGEFFVSAERVGQPGYISWQGLRDMLAVGMSIQSHGCRHRYLTDLTDREAVEELERSRHLIQDKLGAEVTVFSAPGGRITPHLARLAHGLGYTTVCGSRPGYWHPGDGAGILPRFAIRRATPDATVKRWIRGSRLVVWKHAARYQALHAVRSVLGNGLYDRVRERYLDSRSTVAGRGEG